MDLFPIRPDGGKSEFGKPAPRPCPGHTTNYPIFRMTEQSAQDLVEEATFEFTLGNHAAALSLLDQALVADEGSFAAWLAKAEVHFDQRDLDDALAAGERALAIDPEDVHANTSLSRIWMERGDKEQAEHYGAQARIKGWKVELQSEPGED